jgi:ribosomal protein L23
MVQRSRKSDQGKPIKEAISKLWTCPVDPVDSSCRSSAKIKEIRSRKPIKEAISKLWTVPVDHVQKTRKSDQGAKIKVAISKLWTQVHRSQENRSKKPFPNFGQFL